MKKIKSTVLLTVLFATFSLTSCSKDDEVSDGSNATSTGDYYPMAVDNQWTMKQDDTEMEPMKVTGTDVFEGTTYYKLSNSLGGSDMGSTLGFEIQTWIAKKGAAYFTRVGDMSFSQDGITISMNGYEMRVLRDDLPVGGKWDGTIPMKMTFTVEGESESLDMSTKYTGTILEKNVEATVNGVSYPNVIKVDFKQVMSVKDPESGKTETVVIDEEDWYAEGVGPIKRKVVSGVNTAEAILVDYVVKK